MVEIISYHRQLAPNAAVKVSPICLGAMNFGTAWYVFLDLFFCVE